MKYTIGILLIMLLTGCSLPVNDQSTNQTGAICEPWSGTCEQNNEVPTFGGVDLSTESSGILNRNYPAPELVWLQNWINSEGYNSLEELRWQVVLIDFWTLGCVNCIHTFPHLNRLYETYNEQWFEILGFHAPEFVYERKLEAVERAVEQYDLKYPIAQDNDFSTWKAYKNRYWPAHYLIDKQGQVRYVQFGQGRYDALEQAVIELINQ